MGFCVQEVSLQRTNIHRSVAAEAVTLQRQSNQRRSHVIADGSLPHKAYPANQTKPGAGKHCPAIAPSDHRFCKFPYALSTLNPPSFCPLSPEPAPMTRTGQRFFTFLLKTLSLRGASNGLRNGCDVAIAKYAFKPVSCLSLKFQNRVLGGCHPELVEG